MKYIVLVATVVALSFTGLQAQRFVTVDVVTILENMEEYKSAQTELDKTAAEWKQQIDQRRDEIRGLYNKYQSELVLMSDDAKKKKENEIMKKEQALREFQKQKFGPEGALFRKRQELVRPVQQRVYEAIEKYAERKGYDFIFEKGSNAGMLFTNPKYDKTSDIQALLK